MQFEAAGRVSTGGQVGVHSNALRRGSLRNYARKRFKPAAEQALAHAGAGQDQVSNQSTRHRPRRYAGPRRRRRDPATLTGAMMDLKAQAETMWLTLRCTARNDLTTSRAGACDVAELYEDPPW